MNKEQITYLPGSEFIEAGYLHEVNRLVLHPLGLALEMQRVKESGARLTFKAADLEEIRKSLPAVLRLLTACGAPERATIEKLIGSIEQHAEQLPEGDVFPSGVWDYRDDPQGLFFADGTLSAEKAQHVAELMFERRRARMEALGYVIQPPGNTRAVLTTTYVDPRERKRAKR